MRVSGAEFLRVSQLRPDRSVMGMPGPSNIKSGSPDIWRSASMSSKIFKELVKLRRQSVASGLCLGVLRATVYSKIFSRSSNAAVRRG